ncbi:MAG TPA: DoxX family protein [Candidatus Saccharimonadia bacterium]|nr:DoxX family protein [Candidatus Saccharimonadia bacterium]
MNTPATTSKAMYWTGWVLSALPSLMLIMSGVMKLAPPASVVAEMEKSGFPMQLATPLGITELACVVLYLFPRTAVLGAILLAAYLGGAVSSHVLKLDGVSVWCTPVLLGVVLWLGLWLRDARLRALLPFTSKA